MSAAQKRAEERQRVRRRRSAKASDRWNRVNR